MNNLTFGSRIRFVNSKEFNQIVPKLRNVRCVNYPWTVRESVFSESAYTKDVFDCTVCGITDGIKVLLMHICPTREENKNFKQILEYIKSKINLNNSDLQGFILGSKNLPMVINKSCDIFENFERFFRENNIPFSEIKGGLHVNNVAYSSLNDEWIVSHDMLQNCEIKKHFKHPLGFIKQFYNKVEISELDELSW